MTNIRLEKLKYEDLDAGMLIQYTYSTEPTISESFRVLSANDGTEFYIILNGFYINLKNNMDKVQLITINVKDKKDLINPDHYKLHPSGVECITIAEHFNFNRGNAIKYIWRADNKGNAIEDIEKAICYLERELVRMRVGKDG